MVWCFGCCFSRSKSVPFNGVKVIHINGYQEGFEAPITACEVTGMPPYQLLFLPVQLLSGYAKPLRAEESLETGRVYFLLPHSVLQAGPADLAALATRLSNLARRSANATPAKGIRPASIQSVNGESGPVGGGPRPPKARPWKPVLETIREISFRRNMESRESMKSHPNAMFEI